MVLGVPVLKHFTVCIVQATSCNQKVNISENTVEAQKSSIF